MNEKTFGSFVREIRKEKQISVRSLARAIGMSPVYVSSFERGIRTAPSNDVLKNIAKVLVLNEKQIALMYDLAAKSKNYNTLAFDLLVYINGSESVHTALRMAQKYNAGEDDWKIYIDYLRNKYL